MEFTKKNTAIQFYNSLPPWAKGVVVVGGLLGTYAIVKGILKRIKQDAELKKQRGAVEFQNQELQNVIGAGIKPTYPLSQYYAWADEIENQFDGCDFSPGNWLGLPAWVSGSFSYSGTTLANIVENLQNDADFLALNTAYDIRSYDQCGWFMGNVTGTLSKAVNDELSSGEITQINDYLESKGITYKF